jgi:hypothetical protein
MEFFVVAGAAEVGSDFGHGALEGIYDFLAGHGCVGFDTFFVVEDGVDEDLGYVSIGYFGDFIFAHEVLPSVDGQVNSFAAEILRSIIR